MGKQWKQCQTIFLGSKITADGECSHEIKRHLLLGRKVMSNLDSILKSRDITLPTKVCLVKAMVFPVVIYGCESWTVKKAECRRINAFELWCWRRLLRVPWTARSHHSILKEISPQYSLEGHAEAEDPILWPPDAKNRLTEKDPDDGKNWRWEKGTTEDDGCMASVTRWTWVWGSSGSCWWTGKPGLLETMDQRVRLEWVTELNWLICIIDSLCCIVEQLYSN